MNMPHRLSALRSRIADFSTKKKILISLLIVLLLLAGFFLYTTLRVTSNVSKTFKGNGLQALTGNDPLKTDANGISNTIIFGNSSDDPGHGGKLLTDSIMVLSINTITNKAYTTSIPRDFWVDYDQKCSNGTAGKINAVYQCELRKTNDEEKAARALSTQVEDILGIQIQYYAKVNYTFVRDAVNALDGIDVTINSKDPRGILDRTFDKNCPNGPNTCYNVKYENGPVHLDGEHALYLSRARNANGGYGLPRSNFDREVYQQKIVEAIQKKALSTGVLANPLKVIALSDSLGDNISTNIHTSEIKSLLEALNNVGTKDMTSVALNDSDNPLVTTGMQGSQSIVLPTAGLGNYSALRSHMQQALAQ